MISSPATTRTNGSGTLELPAPTVWPFVLAFGMTLVFAGLVTSESVSALGAVLAIAGAVGWFRSVLPHEARESVPVMPEQSAVATTRRDVARLEVADQPRRAWLPLEVCPVSAGLKARGDGSLLSARRPMRRG